MSFTRQLIVRDSTNVASLSYDKVSEKLRVEFLNGSVYDYVGVPIVKFATLVASESIGQSFVQLIKEEYTVVKVME